MTGSTSKTKVLIVDDDAFLLNMYSIKLNEGGYEVVVARDAVELFEKVNNGFAPDVFLLDIVMPGEDGFSVLEKLTQDPRFGKAIKIMLSNLGQEDDVKKAVALGAHGYIVKAVNSPAEVLTRIAEIINNHK